eukprot:COSAG01_NODE_60606_length_293_cov_39.984536_1_plen_75_part_01
MYVCTASSTYLLQVEDGPVWAHVPHRVGRLLMPFPCRRMGLSVRLAQKVVDNLGGGAKSSRFLGPCTEKIELGIL